MVKLFGLVAMLLLPSMLFAADSETGFLDDLGQRSFRFFWEQAHPVTGLIADRAGADGQKQYSVSSIAAVGFGLTAICIADRRGWVEADAAYQRVLNTLRFLKNDMPHERGFFYHFIEMPTGARAWNSEVSSLDTALLMAGVLTVRAYYPDSEVARLATEIYERVDWPWMLNGESTFSMGWKPESGFLSERYDEYSEHLILNLLALGSATHPVPPATWQAWRRSTLTSYAGRVYMRCPPLFTYQYPHAWVDFRDKRDAHADYWRNSVLATEAHRQFCIDLQPSFPKYGELLWGFTASDGPDSYKSWGGPPATIQPGIDGTIVPCAAGGSIPFAPPECLATLQHMRTAYGDRVWKRYGFVDAFNPHTGWTAPDVIGIDVGITLLMAENHRSGFVWEQFMRNPEILRALRLAGFQDTAPTLSAADRNYLQELAGDTWRSIEALIQPAPGVPAENASIAEIGLYLTGLAAAHDMVLLDTDDAKQRIARVLRQVPVLLRSTNAWVSARGMASLTAGLLTVGQAFPEFRADCDQLVAGLDWSAFYDQDQQRLFRWRTTATGTVSHDGPVHRLADTRLASFFAVATGCAPAELWTGLGRDFEEKYHTRYFATGGLLTHYMDGLWLDERGTSLGVSMRNLGYAKLRHAVANSLPAWGWSAVESTAGALTEPASLWDDHIVQPAACAFALADYPAEVVANLRGLEKLGARRPHRGFVTSINLKTQTTDDGQRLLNQSVLFLSLANYLRDGAVQRWFQAAPLVQRGRELLADFRQPAYGPNVAVLTPDPLPFDLRTATQKTAIARRFNNWENPDWHEMDSGNALESGAANGTSARFSFAWDDTTLHFKMLVRQPEVVNDRAPAQLYEQDCVELYIAAQSDGLRWGNAADSQFGFAVGDKVWEWFGQRRTLQAVVQKCADGYTVDAAIAWQALGVTPTAGTTIQVSPAVRSVGANSATTKLNWNWQPQGPVVRLGKLLFE